VGLCGGYRCGCGVTSTPATEGAIDGELPSILVSGSGEPGDPYDLLLNDAWAAAVVNHIDSLAYSQGIYTPTLTGMAIGTGGSPQNEARYSFHGGPDVGDVGILQWEWRLQFGTGGTTFPTSPTIALPPGFQFENQFATSLGTAFCSDSSTAADSRFVQIGAASATAFRFFLGGVSGGTANMTTTTPFTWAAGDSINASISTLAVRV
jgi:hypothetical protein